MFPSTCWLLTWQWIYIKQLKHQQENLSVLISWEVCSGHAGSRLVHRQQSVLLGCLTLFRSRWNGLRPGPCGMFFLADSNLFSHFAVGKLSQGVQSQRSILDRWETSNQLPLAANTGTLKTCCLGGFLQLFSFVWRLCRQQTNSVESASGKKWCAES